MDREISQVLKYYLPFRKLIRSTDLYLETRLQIFLTKKAKPSEIHLRLEKVIGLDVLTAEGQENITTDTNIA